MAIKIYCDDCKKEIPNDNFAFEAQVSEVIVDLNDITPIPPKTLKKTLIQICKECYYRDVLPLFNKNEKN